MPVRMRSCSYEHLAYERIAGESPATLLGGPTAEKCEAARAESWAGKGAARPSVAAHTRKRSSVARLAASAAHLRRRAGDTLGCTIVDPNGYGEPDGDACVLGAFSDPPRPTPTG